MKIENLRPVELIDESTHNGWGTDRNAWYYDFRANNGNYAGWYKKKLECVIDGMPIILKREINEQSSGVVHTEMVYHLHEGEGFHFRFFNKTDDLFKIIQRKDGFYLDDKKIFPINYAEHYIHFIIDLDRGFFEIISDNNYAGKFNFNGKATSVKYISWGYDKDVKGVAEVRYDTRMYKNFFFYDRNTNFIPGKQLPYGYTVKTQGVAKAYKSEKNPRVYSLEAKKDSSVLVERYFDKTSGNIIFDIKYTTYDKNGVLKLGLYNNDTPAFELTDKNGLDLCLDDALLRKHQFKIMQTIRAEVDFTAKTVVLYVNYKKITVISLKNIDLTSVNNFKVELASANGKKTEASFNMINITPLLPLPDDYVPAPIKPKKKGEYYIGMNVCSLWREGRAFGWDAISPYDEAKPLMGYYDEQNPETADWELKFLAEHGIDFELYCWYGQSGGDHICNGHLYAKYSDAVKFALLWCPEKQTVESFRNRIVPIWLDYYFSDPRYMSVDNKLILSMFGAGILIDSFGSPEAVKEQFDYLRKEVRKLGYDDVIIQYCDTRPSQNMADCGFDATQAYSWGRIGYDPDVTKRLNKKAADKKINHMIPTVSAGFNAIGWHDLRTPNATPEAIKDCLTWVRDEYLPQYDKDSWKSKVVIMSTWNEYGEGTYMCPSGLNGFGYLDAVRSVFCEDVPHTDVIPSENQKKRIGTLFPLNRKQLGRQDRIVPDTSKLKPLYKFDFKNKSDLDKWEFNGFESAEIKDGRLVCTSVQDDPFMVLKFDKPIDVDKIYYITTKVRAYKPVEDMCMSIAYLMPESATDWKEKKHIGECYTDPDNVIDMNYRVFGAMGLKGKMSSFRFDPIWAEGACEIENITIYEAQEHISVYINDEVYNMPVFCEKFGDEVYMPFNPRDILAKRKDLYFEWDNVDKTLSLFGKKDAVLTLGSDIAVFDGKEIKLPKEIFLLDGIPMIPVSLYANVLESEYKVTKNAIYLKV